MKLLCDTTLSPGRDGCVRFFSSHAAHADLIVLCLFDLNCDTRTY